jgi:hypothetical protein
MLLAKVYIVSVQKNTSQLAERYSELYHYTHTNSAQEQETWHHNYRRFHTSYLKSNRNYNILSNMFKERGVIVSAPSSVLNTVTSNANTEKSQRDSLQKAESLLFAHFPLKIINKQWNEFKVHH